MSADSPNGSCNGPNSQYIKLVSADGHEFYIKRELAYTSGTLRSMMAGPERILDRGQNEIHLKDLSSHVLVKVCHYFAFNEQIRNNVNVSDFNIDPDTAVCLMMSAHFLDC